MPKRKEIFTENAYYHVFNRGVEKRIIFLDDQDYQTFIDILTYYLKFVKKSFLNALGRIGLTHTGLFQDKITLVAYCLMPNHFHLLVHQKEANATTKFMHRIGVTYSQYFNKRYQRAGPLFQGRFKAKYLDTDPYLLQTSKYIHRNPLTLTRPGRVVNVWSSYKQFADPSIKLTQIDKLVDPLPVLNNFSKTNPQLSYKSFVEETDLADWYKQELKWLR